MLFFLYSNDKDVKERRYNNTEVITRSFFSSRDLDDWLRSYVVDCVWTLLPHVQLRFDTIQCSQNATRRMRHFITCNNVVHVAPSNQEVDHSSTPEHSQEESWSVISESSSVLI